MTDIHSITKKKVLLVDDDPAVVEMIQKILEKYNDTIELLVAGDAGQALEKLLPPGEENKPDALILDIMIPFGNAGSRLHGETDPDELESGMRILEFIRREEKEKSSQPLLVAVITARSLFAIEARIRELKAKLYCKPFNTWQFEDDLARALAIESKVPRILLEDDNK